MVESEDLIVGICSRDIDFYLHPSEGLLYWGYICCAGKKVGFSEEASKYGDYCVLGDRVGILLEFDKTEAKLSFYRNKVWTIKFHHCVDMPRSCVHRNSAGYLLSRYHNVLQRRQSHITSQCRSASGIVTQLRSF